MGNGDSPLASGVSPAGRPSKGSPCQRVVALRGHVVSSTSATMLSCSATPPSERVQLYEAEAHRNARKNFGCQLVVPVVPVVFCHLAHALG